MHIFAPLATPVYFLLFGQTINACQQNVVDTITLFINLGFTVYLSNQYCSLNKNMTFWVLWQSVLL